MDVPQPVFTPASEIVRFPTIIHALVHHAETAPGQPAIRCDERELTYGEYAHAVSVVAGRLTALGVAGERVAVMMANSLEAVLGLLGGMAAGAQVAPVNPNYTDRELTPILTDIAPRVLLCSPDSVERSRALAGTLEIPEVIVLGDGGLTLDEILAAPGGAMPLPRPETPAAMFFTGGTTGLPKGASHDHENLMAFCYGCAALCPFEPGAERILNVAPLFHIWGFCFTFVYPVYVRAFMDLLKAYHPAEVLAEFQKRRITVFAGGPAALYMGLRANENFAQTDYSSLKICLSGGAACPEELLRSWEAATGCVILEGLGMSEGAPIAMNPLNGVRKPASVGVVPPETEVEVVDLETGTRPLLPMERGEVRVRGRQFTKGYRNRPEENARAIRDGWLYTGDVGYFDEDGYLFLVDRKKEMIINGGYNVYPREVDEILFKHPAILEAATVGVPDSFSGEAVKAFIVLKPGATLDADALTAYCRERLVKYKVPTQIEFVDSLPKSAVGKIDKLALKGLR